MTNPRPNPRPFKTPYDQGFERGYDQGFQHGMRTMSAAALIGAVVLVIIIHFFT